MKFSYNWLTSLLNLKKSPQELSYLLTTRAFEVDSCEKVGSDFALDIKVPANRIADAAGHEGFTREIASILDVKYKSPDIQILEKYKKNKELDIKIADEKLCPRYTAQILEVKNIGASPKWMQDRLTTCGIRPIDAVVDITNYVMLATGQPLHAFDFEKILGGKIIVRESKKGETITTLDGASHALLGGAIVIQDAERLIDLAGIMGGRSSAVSPFTKKILLQAAVFDPEKIYSTARDLGFSSSASKIYSAGIDPNQTMQALHSAVTLLSKNAGAKVISAPVDIYPKKTFPKKIFFRPDYADSLIGSGEKHTHYQKIFQSRGWKTAVKKGGLVVEIPTYRHDLFIEEDLIEEAARAIGYENIPSRFPEVKIVPAEKNEERVWETRVRTHFIGAGFTESVAYEFTGAKELDDFFLDRERIVELENPLNPETRYMTPRILMAFVSSAAKNIQHLESVKLFGIGKSFLHASLQSPLPTADTIERKDCIAVIAQKETSGEEGFYELKGRIDQLIESMGIGDHWYDDAIGPEIRNRELRMFHPYRVAEIKVGDTRVGILGELHPEVLKNIKSKARISAAEINFDALWKLAREESEYRAPSKFPAIIRDIALLVPDETRMAEILNVIENNGGALLRDTDLFDYFRDEEMRGENRKSLAFHLVFQSDERTLIESEVDTIMQKIVHALKEKGWLVR